MILYSCRFYRVSEAVFLGVTEAFSIVLSGFIILSLVSNRIFGVIIVFNDVSAFRIFNFSFDSFLFIFNPPVLCNEIPSVIWSFAFIKNSFGLKFGSDSNSSLKSHMALNDYRLIMPLVYRCTSRRSRPDLDVTNHIPTTVVNERSTILSMVKIRKIRQGLVGPVRKIFIEIVPLFFPNRSTRWYCYLPGYRPEWSNRISYPLNW